MRRITVWLTGAGLVAALVYGVLETARAQQSPQGPPPSLPAGYALTPIPDTPAQADTSATATTETSSSVAAAPPAERSTVRAIRAAEGRAARSTGAQTFDPTLLRPVRWGDVPAGGQVIRRAAGGAPVPVVELLDSIAAATNWNIASSMSIEEISVRVWVQAVTPRELLQILQFHGIWYDFNEEINLLQVTTVEEHIKAEYGSIEKATFSIDYAEIVDMEAILSALRSENGKILVDPRTGHIIVWDTQDNINVMSETIAELDQPLTQEVFELDYIDAESVLESIESIVSEVGVAHADLRSNTVIVQDLPARQEQIGEVIKALDQQLETRTWTINYAEVEDVYDRLTPLLRIDQEPLTYDELTHQLSLTAVPARLDEVETVLADWDQPRKQVHIEAYVVSMSTSVARNFGVSWQYFDERSGTSFGLQSGGTAPSYEIIDQGQRLTVGSLPYRVPLTNWWTGDALTDAAGNVILDPEFKGNRLSVVLDLLEEDNQIEVLSRPRVTVMDGEEAEFRNTRDLPYQTGGFTDYGVVDPDVASFNRVIPLQVNFVTVGTILTVTPRVSDEGKVVMEVSAEDSDAQPDIVVVGDQQSTIPQKSESTASTVVTVHDTQTIVIGGLRADRAQDDVEKVPLLGDVPLLGRLFKTTGRQHEEREIMIFLTPTIVDEYNHPEASRLAKFEADLADSLRESQKTLFGRAATRLRGGDNEINVAIGQSGSISVDGEPLTLEELTSRFADRHWRRTTTVLIREHPAAPIEASTNVAERALELGYQVEYGEGAYPFVPVEPPAQPAALDVPGRDARIEAPAEVEADLP